MAGSVIQERGEARYYRHPPAYSAGAPGADGWSLDAGTAMRMASNVGHLVAESKRQLVQSVGPGTAIDTWTTTSAPWAGFPESVTADTNRIPWDRRGGRRFKVLVAVEDRANTDGEPRQRAIRMVVRASLSATTTLADSFFAFAASSTPSPLALNLTGGAAMVCPTPPTQTVPGATGVIEVVADLDTEFLVPIPQRPAPLRCRAGSSRSAAFVRTQPLWLWFGWRIIDPSAGTSAILSFSAFEREPV